MNYREHKLDFVSLAKIINNGVKWKLEYAKRHDGKFNVWRPVIDLHKDRSVDIYWEIVDVCQDEFIARKRCQQLINESKPL